MRNQLYRVTFLMTGHHKAADVTTLQPDMRSAYEWAADILPEAASITVEAPREHKALAIC